MILLDLPTPYEYGLTVTETQIYNYLHIRRDIWVPIEEMYNEIFLRRTPDRTFFSGKETVKQALYSLRRKISEYETLKPSKIGRSNLGYKLGLKKC